MKWKYDSLIKEHKLNYNDSVLSRIQLVRTKKDKYIAITLVSGIYYGIKKQEELEKKNKEWVAYRKKFKDRTMANSYIERKKKAILLFINAREKEI